jgi:hypothetical protein
LVNVMSHHSLTINTLNVLVAHVQMHKFNELYFSFIYLLFLFNFFSITIISTSLSMRSPPPYRGLSMTLGTYRDRTYVSI